MIPCLRASCLIGWRRIWSTYFVEPDQCSPLTATLKHWLLNFCTEYQDYKKVTIWSQIGSSFEPSSRYKLVIEKNGFVRAVIFLTFRNRHLPGRLNRLTWCRTEISANRALQQFMLSKAQTLITQVWTVYHTVANLAFRNIKLFRKASMSIKSHWNCSSFYPDEVLSC